MIVVEARDDDADDDEVGCILSRRAEKRRNVRLRSGSAAVDEEDGRGGGGGGVIVVVVVGVGLISWSSEARLIDADPDTGDSPGSESLPAAVANSCVRPVAVPGRRSTTSSRSRRRGLVALLDRRLLWWAHDIVKKLLLLPPPPPVWAWVVARLRLLLLLVLAILESLLLSCSSSCCGLIERGAAMMTSCGLRGGGDREKSTAPAPAPYRLVRLSARYRLTFSPCGPRTGGAMIAAAGARVPPLAKKVEVDAMTLLLLLVLLPPLLLPGRPLRAAGAAGLLGFGWRVNLLATRAPVWLMRALMAAFFKARTRSKLDQVLFRHSMVGMRKTRSCRSSRLRPPLPL